MKTIILKKGKEDSLLRQHPWLFSGAIAEADGDIEAGDLVRVMSDARYSPKRMPNGEAGQNEAQNGHFLAIGHYERSSIAVRILTFNDEAIDDAFWLSRLRQAYALRTAIGLINNEANDCFRLVHGEGDLLSGLIIDIYGDTAVMQAHSTGMHCASETIARLLPEATEGLVKNVYYKSQTTLPKYIETTDRFLLGSNSASIATENGLKFHVDMLKGQKTGFFLDQRDSRQLLERYAKGRKVLNTFCYTGGFSLYALRGGAQLVHSVDSSERAIMLTDENVKLNFADESRHASFAADTFKFLANATETYNTIILDPPAFAKHRDAVHNALIGYRRLNAAAISKIEDGGILFTFSCSQAISREQFRTAVFTAAASTGRKVSILHQLTQPADHPINIYHPEGEYLKGLVCMVHGA